MTIALLVAYDGTDYGGWQIQKNKITVQERLEGALEEISGKRIPVTASGRTDSGVHAAGQVCHFKTDADIPPQNYAFALNAHLPPDISVLKSAQAPDGFDASRSAKRKTYVYRIYFSPARNPLKDRYAVRVKGGADIEKLRYIAGIFEGVHNFKAYCKSGSKVKTYEREVCSVSVETKESPYSTDVEIRVCGAGFLYNMVRTIAGTMLYFAQGVISEEQIKASLVTGERALVGKTMPPQGLCLESVEYGFKLI